MDFLFVKINSKAKQKITVLKKALELTFVTLNPKDTNLVQLTM